MTIDTFQALFITLVFLVPGFILHSILSLFAPQRIEKIEFSFLRLLTLSSFNFALWSWLIYLVHAERLFGGSVIWEAVAWAVIVFVSPIGLGIVLGVLKEKRIATRIFRFFGYNPILNIPTSWDYKFDEIRRQGPLWISVTLTDGTRVPGWFGTRSFAAASQTGRDIYIEKVYGIGERGEWVSLDNDGIVIRGDDITYIEFWRERTEGKDVEE